MKSTGLFKLLAAALLLCAAATAQEPARVGGRFQKGGLSFDYPAGWALADRSTEYVQDLIITKPGGTAFVKVIAHREPLQTLAQLTPLRDTITTPFVEALARGLGLDKPPQWTESQCIPFGERVAAGFRMAGRLEGQPATGEVYAIVLGQRLVHLVYVRADREEAEGAPAWKSVLDTLKVEPPANPSPEADQFDKFVMGVHAGKALKKPQPGYPEQARSARAQGTVVVEITVDEKGEVVSAQAISGHQLLRGAAVEAAKQAKFSPPLRCGRPVKFTGTISYGFVIQ